MPRGATGESVELAGITWRGHDQCSGPCHLTRQHRLPPTGGIASEIEHRLLGAFALAPWRQHAAREPRRIAAEGMPGLDDGHRRAACGKFEGDGEAGDAGPFDKHPHDGSGASGMSGTPVSSAGM